MRILVLAVLMLSFVGSVHADRCRIKDEWGNYVYVDCDSYGNRGFSSMGIVNNALNNIHDTAKTVTMPLDAIRQRDMQNQQHNMQMQILQMQRERQLLELERQKLELERLRQQQPVIPQQSSSPEGSLPEDYSRCIGNKAELNACVEANKQARLKSGNTYKRSQPESYQSRKQSTSKIRADRKLAPEDYVGCKGNPIQRNECAKANKRARLD